MSSSRAPLLADLTAVRAAPARASLSAEASLDTLLKEHSQRTARPEQPDTQKIDPLDLFRQRLTCEYLEVLSDIARKYEPEGVTMRWNLGSILQGGRELDFTFGFGQHTLVLKGQVVRDAIAFQEIHGRGNVQAELRSGPLLRPRTLTAEAFREFLCTQIIGMVKSAMREQRLSG